MKLLEVADVIIGQEDKTMDGADLMIVTIVKELSKVKAHVKLEILNKVDVSHVDKEKYQVLIVDIVS
jgi:hypothetical protein